MEPLHRRLSDPALYISAGDQELASLAALPGTREALRRLIETHPDGLPPLDEATGWRRLERLAEVAAVDLSLARLYEGHEDARSIVTQLGGEFDPGLPWGVWAAGGAITAVSDRGGFSLSGERHYCSGAGIVERALVAVGDGASQQLFIVDAVGEGMSAVPGSWPATGMAASASSTVRFSGAEGIPLGPAGAYQSRPGFWAGSLNVTACWYGGALGLYRWTVANRVPPVDPTALGGMRAEIAVMRTLLEVAAAEASASTCGDGFERAMVVRHAIHGGCRRVIALAERLGGSDAIARDRDQSRRFADLPVYLSQHSQVRELASIAPKSGDWP